MEEKKKLQSQRMDTLLELSKDLRLSAENLKLISEGYGNENSHEEKLQKMANDARQILFLVNVIRSVATNGEDQYRVVSC